MYDLDTAIKFGQTLFPESTRALGSPVLMILDETAKKAEAFPWRDNGDLEAVLKIGTDRKALVTFSPAMRKLGFDPVKARGQGKKEDCVATSVFKTDFDPFGSTLPKTPLTEQVKQLIVNTKLPIPFEPAFFVDSGGGLHGYYLSTDPIFLRTAQEIRQYEDINRSIIDFWAEAGIPCDVDRSIVDVTRMMRLPGSVNFRYDKPRLTKIYEVTR